MPGEVSRRSLRFLRDFLRNFVRDTDTGAFVIAVHPFQNRDDPFGLEDGEVNMIGAFVSVLSQHRRQVGGGESAPAQVAPIDVPIPDQHS